MTKKPTVGNSTYDAIKQAVEKTEKTNAPLDQDENQERTSRKMEKVAKSPRKKTYERVVETNIPQHVIDAFAADDYELRWIRFQIGGALDLRNLSKREREGYEFVKAEEVPEDFLAGLKIVEGKANQGLVTSGDVCLMKVDSDLRKSRADFYNKQAASEYNAADVYNMTRRKGLVDTGSKSSVSTGKEPKFQ